MSLVVIQPNFNSSNCIRRETLESVLLISFIHPGYLSFIRSSFREYMTDNRTWNYFKFSATHQNTETHLKILTTPDVHSSIIHFSKSRVNFDQSERWISFLRVSNSFSRKNLHFTRNKQKKNAFYYAKYVIQSENAQKWKWRL